MMTRDEALALMHEYTESHALRKHMYAVELAMRAYAQRFDGDEEAWGLVGLLHDFDYDRHPNHEHNATKGHPSFGVGLLRGRGVSEEVLEAILGHAPYTGVPRESRMAKTLFAVDELCGFLVACALVRPSRSLKDLEYKSFKKKFKDKAFARGVSRDDIQLGAEQLGIPMDEHVRFTIEALRTDEERIGLGPK
ncbi:MAG: HDIG domain-containing protein [Gemmatimonadetes bacterium]|nr:HDIG domain-containing protein [Gemmatimonadota bacterium]